MRGIRDTLQEGTMAPTGVAVSVQAKPTEVSPAHHTLTIPTNLSHSITLSVQQHVPPWSWSQHCRLTMEFEEGPIGPRGSSWERGAAVSAATREGTTSTAAGVTDRTQPEEQSRHIGPAELEMAREAPIAALQWARRCLHNRPHWPHLRPP